MHTQDPPTGQLLCHHPSGNPFSALWPEFNCGSSIYRSIWPRLAGFCKHLEARACCWHSPQAPWHLMAATSRSKVQSAAGAPRQPQVCADASVVGQKSSGSSTSRAHVGALAAVGGLPMRSSRSRGGQQRLAVGRWRALVGDGAHRLGQPLHALLLRRLRSKRQRSPGLSLH